LIFVLLATAIFPALLVHECGHFLAARALRVPVIRVAIGCGPILMSFNRLGIRWNLGLVPLSASVAYHGDIREIPFKYLAVLCAGPLASLLAGAAALGLTWLRWQRIAPDVDQLFSSPAFSFLWIAGSLSLAIGVFNLIPLPPLDGAAIFVTAVSMLKGRSCKPQGRVTVHLAAWTVRALTLTAGVWLMWSLASVRWFAP
jgi:membrane-associated protease RseP (regulator of RpoE activity)